MQIALRLGQSTLWRGSASVGLGTRRDTGSRLRTANRFSICTAFWRVSAHAPYWFTNKNCLVLKTSGFSSTPQGPPFAQRRVCQRGTCTAPSQKCPDRCGIKGVGPAVEAWRHHPNCNDYNQLEGNPCTILVCRRHCLWLSRSTSRTCPVRICPLSRARPPPQRPLLLTQGWHSLRRTVLPFSSTPPTAPPPCRTAQAARRALSAAGKPP